MLCSLQVHSVYTHTHTHYTHTPHHTRICTPHTHTHTHSHTISVWRTDGAKSGYCHKSLSQSHENKTTTLSLHDQPSVHKDYYTSLFSEPLSYEGQQLFMASSRMGADCATLAQHIMALTKDFYHIQTSVLNGHIHGGLTIVISGEGCGTEFQQSLQQMIIINNEEDFYSAHLPHKVGAQGALQ